MAGGNQRAGMMRVDDDAETLARIGGGDLEAFEEIYARYSRRVYAFTLRVLRNPELVEEAVSFAPLPRW